ncbi:hypothetical protein [Bacillus sp. ISL-45]|uniref:hypothetical protein n=1 Tax=Bacillus sp. ISL-45 TaxID=2819128 RepID=UPI0020366515|nr:hypothetical protein [Bacillus sp. ISL-45]
MKSKILSILTTGALALSLVAPAVSVPEADAATTAKWDIERYGDRVDIDSRLDQLSRDEEFLKKAEQSIKEQAEGIQFDENVGSESGAADSTFTFDGVRKSFWTETFLSKILLYAESEKMLRFG